MPSSSSSLLGYDIDMIIISMIIVIVIDTITVTAAVIDTTVTVIVIVTVIVTVFDDIPSLSHSPSSANTKTRLKHGHYIAKSINRLLSIFI